MSDNKIIQFTNTKSNAKARPKADDKSVYGANIEAIRTTKGFTRTEIADKMNITLGAVSAWEYGRTRPDIDSLKRLCEILNVSSDEILGITQGYASLSKDEQSADCRIKNADILMGCWM